MPKLMEFALTAVDVLTPFLWHRFLIRKFLKGYSLMSWFSVLVARQSVGQQKQWWLKGRWMMSTVLNSREIKCAIRGEASRQNWFQISVGIRDKLDNGRRESTRLLTRFSMISGEGKKRVSEAFSQRHSVKMELKPALQIKQMMERFIGKGTLN